MFNYNETANTISENLDKIRTYHDTIINKRKSKFTLPQLKSSINNILLEIEDELPEEKKQLAKQYILECEHLPNSLCIITNYCINILNDNQDILSDDEIDKYSSIETYRDKYTYIYNIHIENITSLVNDNKLTLEQFNTQKEYFQNILENISNTLKFFLYLNFLFSF